MALRRHVGRYEKLWFSGIGRFLITIKISTTQMGANQSRYFTVLVDLNYSCVCFFVPRYTRRGATPAPAEAPIALISLITNGKTYLRFHMRSRVTTPLCLRKIKQISSQRALAARKLQAHGSRKNRQQWASMKARAISFPGGGSRNSTAGVADPLSLTFASGKWRRGSAPCMALVSIPMA